jgi:dipeptidyl aminopeptidase/acylaminoacyl peptidase
MIHGFLIKPTQFDSAQSYPVIENIYAGPHGFHVPKKFGLQISQRRLAELGFIIAKIDGMGTNWRSKKFHDHCWQNLADAGFPDRIAWLKAAAQKYSWLDLSRVGIYGGSAGGQNALSALLHHGEFYKTAVSDCGCHDNRMDKIWWNEAWMGKMGPHYEQSSNVFHAHKLQGDLMLTVGELDKNVDPASTLQVVDALVRAGKDFEFFMIPGAGHGVGEGKYLFRKRIDFFVRSLLRVERKG